MDLLHSIMLFNQMTNWLTHFFDFITLLSDFFGLPEEWKFLFLCVGYAVHIIVYVLLKNVSLLETCNSTLNYHS